MTAGVKIIHPLRLAPFVFSNRDTPHEKCAHVQGYCV